MKRWMWIVTLGLVLLSVLIKVLDMSLAFVFLGSCLAIIPLAAVMGRATEAVAAKAGPRLGGLLSATFGNAVELIIGIMALHAGLSTLVKASITGSILGNLLFVLGISFFVGGMRHPIQRFNVRAARSNAALLLLGVGVAFVIPAIFGQGHRSQSLTLSASVAIISLLLYLSGLYFALFTHRDLFESIERIEEAPGPSSAPPGDLTKVSKPLKLWPAVLLLLAATLLVSLESEWLVESLKQVSRAFGWSDVFMGVVVVAVVGNAAEHASAVWMAWKNRMDLSLEIAVGSSLQVAMFVAPILFGASLLFGHPMALVFSWPELVSMMVAVLLVVVLLVDGESNWLEGAMAVGAYLVMAVGFFTL